MKAGHSPWFLALLLVGAAGLSACSTPSTRIERNSARFASYPPDAQALIREGRIDLGFTPDMVKMALGKPSRVWTRRDQQGTETIWSYLTYRTYPGLVSYDSYIHYRYRRAYPWYPLVEWDEWTETIRVRFREGKVTVVESRDEHLTPG